MIRIFMLVGIFVGSVLALGSCHYSEAQLWEECCILRVYTDETSSSEGRAAILGLGARSFFNGEGRGGLSIDQARQQRQRVEGQVDSFLDGRGGTRPSDYFTGLGMNCRSVNDPKDGLVQCEADLQVWIKCDKLRFVPFGHVPVPKELQQPISAVLHVSVRLSGSKVLDIYSRVFPAPGGRLCHR